MLAIAFKILKIETSGALSIDNYISRSVTLTFPFVFFTLTLALTCKLFKIEALYLVFILH